MRIAMVGTRGIPARCGGVERVVEELSREMTARGHDVIVYCRPHYVERAQLKWVRTIATPGLPGKFLDTITHTATAMFDLLRRGVDIVHIHSPGPALLSWIPAAAGLGLVFTVHAPDWRRRKWSPFARAAIRAGLSCGMRFSDAVTSVSKPLADELSKAHGIDVAHVPNAVRPAKHLPAGNIRQWSLQPGGYALYVGRIVPEKSLDVLLEAWRQVRTDRLLVVAGDSDETAYGRRCRCIAGQNVLFIGPQYGRTLGELYSNAAVVIQPSELEGMSLVVLEAANYEKCIIAADIPANRQVLGEAGLYFRPGDVSELCCQIRRSDREEVLVKSLGRKAKKYVQQCYNWSRTADLMEEIYRQVLEDRRK